MWTRERLCRYVKTRLGESRLVVVANRETYVHEYEDGEILAKRPPGGLVAAIDPILEATQGVMVAHGSGAADRDVVDEHDRVQVPPQNPKYTLRRIWLTPEEVDGYYHGVSNEALWPLCHLAYTRPTFSADQWGIYQHVNQKFAEAVLDEVGDDPALVWLQDYHLALVPAMLKARRPDLLVGHFWHIPWPNFDIFRVCPWRQELLWGLLGNDVIGFHTEAHCSNFLQCCNRQLEVRVDEQQKSIYHHGGIETAVRSLPISIDAESAAAEANCSDADEIVAHWQQELGLTPERKLLLGVDRLDYTKGIPERLRAYSILLERYPTWRERIVFLQIGASTRSHIESYRLLEEEVDSLIAEVNAEFGTDNWVPVVRARRQVIHPELAVLYRLADVCVVSSLHDGMNLVAKEFLAAKNDHSGMLVLSQFTGAAQELPEAILVNPYSEDECAEAFHEALTMPEDDRVLRMETMRETIMENNIFRWAARSIAEMVRII